MFQPNFNGLRKRETYDEIIDYLQNDQEIIRYPDRFARRIREHPYLTQLDGEGMREMEEQQLQQMREQEKENRLREIAVQTDATLSHLRAAATEDRQHPVVGAMQCKVLQLTLMMQFL